MLTLFFANKKILRRFEEVYEATNHPYELIASLKCESWNISDESLLWSLWKVLRGFQAKEAKEIFFLSFYQLKIKDGKYKKMNWLPQVMYNQGYALTAEVFVIPTNRLHNTLSAKRHFQWFDFSCSSFFSSLSVWKQYPLLFQSSFKRSCRFFKSGRRCTLLSSKLGLCDGS